ncbi:MAG TPA: cyclic pyranopterin monophosphate synthase MoaC [Candidatus Azoamicus sp.]
MYTQNKYRMIDISKKNISYRRACVYGSIYVGKKVFFLIKNKKIEKGDPLILAEISGINAAKNISNLILLAHQINIENIFINIVMDDETFKIHVYCIVIANSKTGVEMEAMCGVTMSLLTIYDLTKKLNPFIEIEQIKLLFKDGGENGLVLGSLNNVPTHLKKYFEDKNIDLNNIKIFIITMSDRSFIGSYKDISGQIIFDFFKIRKSIIQKKIIIPDNDIILKNIIYNAIHVYSPHMIIITGGTGLNKKDITYNTLSNICDKTITGISELLRLYGTSYSTYSWLSSSFAGIYKNSIIFAIPGNPSSTFESLNTLEKILPHILNSTL